VAAEAMFQKEGIAEIFDKLEAYTIMIPNPATPKKLDGHATSSLAAKDHNIWHHLTSSMKGAMLKKITGREWNEWQVSSSHDFKDPIPSMPDDRNPNKGHDEVLRFIFPKSLRFWHAAAVGRERTEQALDSSAHILSVIHEHCTYEDSDEIIGELQFCFLTGMLLGNLACMEHWAHVVKVCKISELSFHLC
jgi:A1 cistron-splicing factor AAR2